MAANISSHPNTAGSPLASLISSRCLSLRPLTCGGLSQLDTASLSRKCLASPSVRLHVPAVIQPRGFITAQAAGHSGHGSMSRDRTSNGLHCHQSVHRYRQPLPDAILHKGCLYRADLRSHSPVSLPPPQPAPAAAAAAAGAAQTAAAALPAGASPSLGQLPAGEALVHTLADLLSKSLGYLVICGSLFLKVPQILRILRNKSVQGLSVLSFELECLGFTMALAYCISKGIPFHVYGELFFILGQSATLVLLLYHFSSNRRYAESAAKVVGYLGLAAVLFLGRLPPQVFDVIYNLQTTMFTISRLPQMWTNFKSRSTGELSVTSSLLSVAGLVARLYTSIHERAPRSMVFGSLAGLLTHGFLLFQIFIYRPKKAAAETGN